MGCMFDEWRKQRRACRTTVPTYLPMPTSYRCSSSASAAKAWVVETAEMTSSAVAFASARASCVSVESVRM